MKCGSKADMEHHKNIVFDKNDIHEVLTELAVAAAAILARKSIGSGRRKRVVTAICAAAKAEFFSDALAAVDVASVKEPKLPDHPPRNWFWKTHRRLQETPPDFICRVYKVYLSKGMSKRQLRKFDITLAIALYRWTEEHGEDPRLAGKLLTLRERNDIVLELYAPLRRGPNDTLSRELLRRGAILANRGL